MPLEWFALRRPALSSGKLEAMQAQIERQAQELEAARQGGKKNRTGTTEKIVD
jgi:hypothetical protein